MEPLRAPEPVARAEGRTTRERANAAPWKEVWFRTPVILGNANLPPTYEGELVRYQKDAILHENLIPPVCERLSNGMVIDMPTEDIESWVAERLHWLQLCSDEELVDRLHRLLHQT